MRAYVLFALSVFFSFSIFGYTADMINKFAMPPAAVLFWSLYSGFVGAGFAYSFTRNMKALPVVLVVMITFMFVPPDNYSNAGSIAANQNWKLIFDSAGIYASVILGYIFFIIFITQEGIKQIQMRTEMDLAAGMHEVLVPSIEFKNDKFEVYGMSNPALEIGGDLIDFYKDDGHFTAYIADVSGHGIDAGLLMGMFKAAVYSKLTGDISLTRLANDVNKILHKLKKPAMFITCSMIRFNQELPVEFITAGHLPILHFQKDLNIVSHLLIKQIPITVKEDFAFISSTAKYSEGDIFVLLTDGIVEVMDKGGEEFGLSNVEKILIENHNETAKYIYDRLTESVKAFGKLADDQSAIIIKSLEHA